MNAKERELRKEALRLLGIADEGHLSTLSSLVKRDELSGAALADLLPNNLLSLANVLRSDDYRERIPHELMESIPEGIVKQAREICLNQFPKLVEHPAYSDALLLAHDRLQRELQSKRSEEDDVVGDIRSASAFPLLTGDAPPYTPALKVSISTNYSDKAISQTLRWQDLLFLARAFIQQVSEHAANSAEMVRSGIIRSLDAEIAGQIVKDLEKYTAELKENLAPPPQEKDE